MIAQSLAIMHMHVQCHIHTMHSQLFAQEVMVCGQWVGLQNMTSTNDKPASHASRLVAMWNAEWSEGVLYYSEP